MTIYVSFNVSNNIIKTGTFYWSSIYSILIFKYKLNYGPFIFTISSFNYSSIVIKTKHLIIIIMFDSQDRTAAGLSHIKFVKRMQNLKGSIYK